MTLPQIKVTLRNVKTSQLLDYYITPEDNQLAADWINALKGLLQSKNPIEKNYCFLGFPTSTRTVEYLCNELNHYVHVVNMFNETNTWQDNGLEPYIIDEYFCEDTVRFNDTYPIGPGEYKDGINLGLRIKHSTLNRLHLHFERLQGTVWRMSEYYKLADAETKFAIRQLNNLCHELEGKILCDRKFAYNKEWVRPSQITTFLHAPRYELTDEHRVGFIENGYDREFGAVYMHWTQIGKTLFEVWRDEGAPDLIVGNDPTDISANDGTTSEAINSLKYYSGEFDVEWAKSVCYNDPDQLWHKEYLDEYYSWLTKHGVDINEPKLGLGYLKIGSVDLIKSFGTSDMFEIWNMLGDYLDIYKIKVDSISSVYEYSWADADHVQNQIEFLRPGYDYSSNKR